ncbi:MAG: glycerol-3-phosphate responsive antiterminator [Oscillospiraceae bacterium]|jgi:glycerol uptake operon antiterminator|nr:glycerol-3-phosphate responsive antiterminator [Oscillospiraceae bacterium]MDD3230403.1 glycerol-3-phosphate responsive antiterminator [Oscillospiraceae bacterium]
MHALGERIIANPVIAAVKTEGALQDALKSDCDVIFLLTSTVMDVKECVEKIHEAQKLAVVHVDLVEGLSTREIAVDGLISICHPDGIISTHPTLIRRARHRGLLTVQRAFILDSMSITSLYPQLELGKPDFVEILPGIIPRVVGELCKNVSIPVITGGLIHTKEEVMANMAAGAVAISTSCPDVWAM